MRESHYQAGPPADATVESDGARWVLVFSKDLRHPPAVVWRALTDPGELRAWAPFDADRDLGRPGPATLSMAGGPAPEPSPALVRRAEPPTLLEYTWGEDLLRWELTPTPQGTRLTLRHTLADRSWLPKVTAGWHICLDVAERHIDGDPVGRIVAEAARQHGWERLEQAYAARFG
jgi:uncharacterized protein YndB with AHSA1/START domain